MDASLFFRLLICQLALRLPLGASTAATAVKEALSSASCYVKIKLDGRTFKTAPLHIISCDSCGWFAAPRGSAVAFDFTKAEMKRFAKKAVNLTLEVYATFDDCPGLSLPPDWFLGSTNLLLDLKKSMCEKIVEHHSGWKNVEMKDGPCFSQLHFTVATEQEERFVFKFGDDPAANPRVSHVQGSKATPLFSCFFGRFCPDSFRARVKTGGLGLKQWIKSKLRLGEKDQQMKERENERKDWSVTVLDQSGFPAAMALMTEPFVPTTDSESVTFAKPGSWVILQAKNGSKWAPWGKLSAWNDDLTTEGGITFKLERLVETPDRIPVWFSSASTKEGGVFSIDLLTDRLRGFAMSSTVKGEGKRNSPRVEVAAKCIQSKEDMAAYVALAAAVNLSVDACQTFSRPLRKILRRGS